MFRSTQRPMGGDGDGDGDGDGSPGKITTPPRPSTESPSSFHALDETFEQPVPVRRASSQNTADDTANLNIIDIEASSENSYADIEGQVAFRSMDRRGDKDRSYKRLFWTILIGRAMPIGKLFLAILWSVAAVVISWATRRTFEGTTCRWWCTPLAVDSDALSYVGFALFLLTSFRVSEAYSRYMEAARVWTNISGTVTSFAKYVVQAFPNGMIHKGDTQRILSFLVAFPIALKRELRGERDLRELKSVLTPSDMARLQKSEMVESMGWLTIVIVAFISYGILGVVSNADELEDPFGSDFNDLPLGKMAEKIQMQVATIYHACRKGTTAFVREVRADHLQMHPEYWLNVPTDAAHK